MATRKRSKRKTVVTKPLVSNPFDAAKRVKKSVAIELSDRNDTHDNGYDSQTQTQTLSQLSQSESYSILMPPPLPKKISEKPAMSKSNTLCSILPFDSLNEESVQVMDCSNQSVCSTNGHLLEYDGDSNQSHSWLQYKKCDFSQSIDEYNNYLTPMEQPQQTHFSQLDVITNRNLNHTKSKLSHNTQKHSHSAEHKEQQQQQCQNSDDLKMEYIAKKDLKIPSQNQFLSRTEMIDLNQYKKQQKGIVTVERYHTFYDEISLLGNGSFGKVYLCRNRDDGCFYAVKKLKIQTIHNNKHTLRTKYMKEGFVLSALQRFGVICENIVLYYAMWIEFNCFYLVTEFCDYGNLYNLYDLCQQQSNGWVLNEGTFCTLIQHISNALDFIHSKGFVHFDVKPENVLICKNAVFKLADFGLCTKIVGGDSFNKFDEGDARYLSRELIEQTFVIQQLEKIDIFALGCTVYEMLIGEDLPANGFKWQQIRNGNLKWSNKVLSISHNMKQLVVNMMHSDPNERPSAKQLNVYLRLFTDKLLQDKETEIQSLRQKLQMLHAQ